MNKNKIYLKIHRLISHRHFVKYEKYASLILWLLAIYLLSSRQLLFLSVHFDIWAYILRKLAHMFEFGFLAYLIFRILSQTEKRHFYWNLWWALAFSVLYAISDEYHQTLVESRHGVYTDVLIDSVGILVAIWLLYLHHHHLKIIRQQKQKNGI